MKEMRILGSTARKFAEEKSVTAEALGRMISCTPQQIEQFYKGRLFLRFDQLHKMAEYLGVSTDVLLDGDEEYYQKNMVHCMGTFSKQEAREEILDIIDDYLDLCACNNQE